MGKKKPTGKKPKKDENSPENSGSQTPENVTERATNGALTTMLLEGTRESPPAGRIYALNFRKSMNLK